MPKGTLSPLESSASKPPVSLDSSCQRRLSPPLKPTSVVALFQKFFLQFSGLPKKTDKTNQPEQRSNCQLCHNKDRSCAKAGSIGYSSRNDKCNQDRKRANQQMNQCSCEKWQTILFINLRRKHKTDSNTHCSENDSGILMWVYCQRSVKHTVNHQECKHEHGATIQHPFNYFFYDNSFHAVLLYSQTCDYCGV